MILSQLCNAQLLRELNYRDYKIKNNINILNQVIDKIKLKTFKYEVKSRRKIYIINKILHEFF